VTLRPPGGRPEATVPLAAWTGVADAVADVVENGRSLRENGLHPVADWLEAAPHLNADRAASFLRGDEVRALRRTMGGPP